MQKAYLVGRTEVLDGFSGTHLYIELIYNYNFYEPFLENINKIKSSMFNSWRYRQFEMTDIIRELDKKEKGHIMPVVFTAMLFENNNLFEEIFSLEYWISQTPQVYLDYQAKNISGKLNISYNV